MTCNQCNLENTKRISRAYYVRPDCGRDVSFEWVLYMESKGDDEETEDEVRRGKK